MIQCNRETGAEAGRGASLLTLQPKVQEQKLRFVDLIPWSPEPPNHAEPDRLTTAQDSLCGHRLQSPGGLGREGPAPTLLKVAHGACNSQDFCFHMWGGNEDAKL